MRTREILYHFPPKKVTNEIHLLLCFANFLWIYIHKTMHNLSEISDAIF